MAMYDQEQIVKASFDLSYISEYLLQAQWAELVELKEVITEVYGRRGAPLEVLDIGIGDARVAKHLSGIEEIWDKVGHWDGIDNAMACVQLAGEVVAERGLQDKVSVRFFDATNLDQLARKYDLVVTTWFTAGNFYPPDFPFATYGQEGERLDLERNETFEKVFSAAWALLRPGGELVFGSCYRDTDTTRQRQEEAYRKMGMTPITDAQDSFVATREGFWSQRFTEEKLRRYASFAEPQNISFTLLDTYEFAMQVRMRKEEPRKG
jgi:SAM-dependent methyltransferase